MHARFHFARALVTGEFSASATLYRRIGQAVRPGCAALRS